MKTHALGINDDTPRVAQDPKALLSIVNKEMLEKIMRDGSVPTDMCLEYILDYARGRS